MNTLASALPVPTARSVERPRATRLCAHCSLPVGGGSDPAEDAVLFCCGGCALAHRITGGLAGDGAAAGMLMALGLGAFFSMNVMMLSFVLYTGGQEADRLAGEAWVRWALLGLATPSVLLLGAPFVSRGLRRGRRMFLDTDVLIVLGVGAAYLISAWSVLVGRGPLYLDTACGILLFMTIGRYLEAATRARTHDALSRLAASMPTEAWRITPLGDERVAVDRLEALDRVRVRPGERIPVDGVIREGEAGVSEAEITGESMPVHRRAGDPVSAGTLNLDGALEVEVLRRGGDTTLARIVRIVEEARLGRYPLAALVDRVSARFVPVILLIAASTFVYWTFAQDLGAGVLNALCVLLIACPCAIGIATPLAAVAASGRAASSGVLVRAGETFERLARANRVFFDKTGTLTSGWPRVVGFFPTGGADEDAKALSLAAGIERHSEHPVARAIVRFAEARGVVAAAVSGFRAAPGRGASGIADGGELRVGTAAFAGVDSALEMPGATEIWLSLNGRGLARFELLDSPRPSAAPALRELRTLGLPSEILSGDNPAAVLAIARGLGDIAGSGGLTPEQKVARLDSETNGGDAAIMVGDGINDAPALSRAAVGVTLEGGTDLARELADVTILGGDLTRLPWLIRLSRATLKVARWNLFWAFFYNLVGVGLAVSGRLHPLFGALAMIVSSLVVVLNSQRLSRIPLA
ncbi:MAG TPA: cation-translocating P-type ATPase, partial [Vicinamibacteria bacterium]|nr:cation-translocating P-type ATPase [Vicinamibacteria bacterium]